MFEYKRTSFEVKIRRHALIWKNMVISNKKKLHLTKMFFSQATELTWDQEKFQSSKWLDLWKLNFYKSNINWNERMVFACFIYFLGFPTSNTYKNHLRKAKKIETYKITIRKQFNFHSRQYLTCKKINFTSPVTDLIKNKFFKLIHGSLKKYLKKNNETKSEKMFKSVIKLK